MGTGIVSLGLALDHELVFSLILFGIGVVLWSGLFVLLVEGVLRRKAHWLAAIRAPGGLTAVAGTAVIGARVTLLGIDWAGDVLLVVAVCLWACFVPLVLRHWTTPTIGTSFVLAVATESLAVLAARLAVADRLAWLAAAALAPLGLGLVAYLFALARVDLRQLSTGRGDHWIFGGALAIATLACARIAAALGATSTLAGLRPALDGVTLALWAAAMLWLPALLVSELFSPRIGYDMGRWSTVFPLGMYAVCSMAAADASGIGGIGSFGRMWIWLALAVWTAVFAGMVVRATRLVRG